MKEKNLRWISNGDISASMHHKLKKYWLKSTSRLNWRAFCNFPKAIRTVLNSFAKAAPNKRLRLVTTPCLLHTRRHKKRGSWYLSSGIVALNFSKRESLDPPLPQIIKDLSNISLVKLLPCRREEEVRGGTDGRRGEKELNNSCDLSRLGVNSPAMARTTERPWFPCAEHGSAKQRAAGT